MYWLLSRISSQPASQISNERTTRLRRTSHSFRRVCDYKRTCRNQAWVTHDSRFMKHATLSTPCMSVCVCVFVWGARVYMCVLSRRPRSLAIRTWCVIHVRAVERARILLHVIACVRKWRPAGYREWMPRRVRRRNAFMLQTQNACDLPTATSSILSRALRLGRWSENRNFLTVVTAGEGLLVAQITITWACVHLVQGQVQTNVSLTIDGRSRCELQNSVIAH